MQLPIANCATVKKEIKKKRKGNTDELVRKQQIIEHSLNQWLLNEKSVFVITNELLLVKARKLGSQLNISGFSYSLEWLEDFKKRYNINEKKSKNIDIRGMTMNRLQAKNQVLCFGGSKEVHAPVKVQQPYFISRDIRSSIQNAESTNSEMFHRLSPGTVASQVDKSGHVLPDNNLRCKVLSDHAGVNDTCDDTDPAISFDNDDTKQFELTARDTRSHPDTEACIRIKQEEPDSMDVHASIYSDDKSGILDALCNRPNDDAKILEDARLSNQCSIVMHCESQLDKRTHTKPLPRVKEEQIESTSHIDDSNTDCAASMNIEIKDNEAQQDPGYSRKTLPEGKTNPCTCIHLQRRFNTD